jgi:hypothetical protein
MLIKKIKIYLSLFYIALFWSFFNRLHQTCVKIHSSRSIHSNSFLELGWIYYISGLSSSLELNQESFNLNLVRLVCAGDAERRNRKLGEPSDSSSFRFWIQKNKKFFIDLIFSFSKTPNTIFVNLLLVLVHLALRLDQKKLKK